MRELHVLGVSDDGTTLLLGTTPDAGRPSHRIAVDDRLRAAVRGQLAPPGTDRVESALPPREIQARLRAGDTPEEVAKAAGVPVARVLPYAAPVEAERQRIVDEARAQIVHRARGVAPTRPLGEVADAHLAEVNGLKPESVEWAARRRADGSWEVSLGYAGRGGRRTASWLWRPAERELTALDPAAARLALDAAAPSRRGATRRSGAKQTTKKAAKKPVAKASKKTAKKMTRKAAGAPPRPRADRVPVPSWSDVLLGVQGTPTDAAARRRRPASRNNG